MADYSSKYLFEARAVGIEKSANQLNKLAAALNNLSAASNSAKGANVAGVVSGTGATAGTGAGTTTSAAAKSAKAAGAYDPNSYIPSGPQIARALSYSAAIAGAYAAMGLVTSAIGSWVDAQVEFNRVLIDTQNTLGGTTQDVADFADKIRYLSYLSGEAFSESSLVARREEILGRPGMGASAAGLNVVFGESLDLSTAAEDITAIQTQFGSSFGDINDTLLALVQTSGITADELMSMSETWGALTDDLQLGGRNIDTMREIGALMASMSVVMGESGTVIETFLRKLERIYTDPKVSASLEGIGVSVRDASGEFRSLIDILDEISARGLGDEAYDALEWAFPNQLGQKSKQQLREFFNQIDLITGIVDDAVKSTANFDEALVRANSKLDVLGERLGAAFDNWLSAVGDLSGASETLAGIAAALQNSATRIGPGGMGTEGYRALAELEPGEFTPFSSTRIENELFDIVQSMMGGPSSVPWARELEAKQLISALPGDFFGAITGAQQQREYLSVAAGMFKNSDYYTGGGNIDTVIQDFLLYMEMSRDQVDNAFSGISDAARGSTTELWSAASAADVFASSALAAASSLSAIEPIYDPQGRRVMLGGLGWSEAANPSQIGPYYPPSEKWAAKERRDDAADKDADRALREQESFYRKSLAEQEAYQRKMLGAWDSMVDSLLRPTSVTAGDVALSKVGAYQDKWDEPLRTFRADINHLIKGEPEQYGSMERFKDYIDPNLLAAAMGADQETKESLFRGIEDIVADKFLSLQMPAEMYNKDALISSARDWIAGEQQSKETRATMEGWLTEAGIDSEFAKMFLDDQGTPAIVKAMTGGWSPEQIQDEVGGSIPDIAGVVGDQFTEMDWAGMFASSVEASVTNDYQSLVSAGAMLAKPIVEGAGDTIVDTLVPRIIEAVAAYYE